MSQNHERREHQRFPVAARVRFKKDGKEVIWMTKDISEGGLFLVTPEPPFVGEILEIELSLPTNDKLIKAKGEVMWRAMGQGCGLRFTRTTAAMRDAIAAFMAQNPNA